MRRREFISLMGGGLLLQPLPVLAEGAAKVPRIGILDFFPSAASADFMVPFGDALRELGYVDGQNIHLEYHSAEQQRDRAAEIAAAFVREGVDLIVASATPAAHAAKSATGTIPIVISVADPVATGLVASLARPGANLTGVSSTSPDLAGKRLELLRELRPGIARVGFLGAQNDPNTSTFIDATRAAARSIGIDLHAVLVTGPDEFDGAFASLRESRVEGLLVQPLFVGHRAKLVQLALDNRLPLIADQPAFAASGALVAYGINRAVLFRRAAYYVDRILKGAKPAELPVEQPTTYQLVINLKTARALGLTVSPMLAARADEVIE